MLWEYSSRLVPPPPLPSRVKVMRKDAVYAVLLNVTLFRGMSCSIAQDPRYLRFSVLTPSGTMHYNLRVGSAQAASDLLKVINDNIPHA